MLRTATSELYCAFIIEFIDTFRVKLIEVREVRALGFAPMENPKMGTLFDRPFSCLALVRVIDLALWRGHLGTLLCKRSKKI